MTEVKLKPIWYVCSPYSKYETGIVKAWKDICEACGKLLKRGIPIFSPIAHSHGVAVFGGIDPYDHDVWMALDQHIMNAADGCIVVMMPGWKESKGVKLEIAEFEDADKPVRYFTWPGMREVPKPCD